MNDPVRLMLVEDNPRYREAIGFALRDEPGLRLVGEFGTAVSIQNVPPAGGLVIV